MPQLEDAGNDTIDRLPSKNLVDLFVRHRAVLFDDVVNLPVLVAQFFPVEFQHDVRELPGVGREGDAGRCGLEAIRRRVVGRCLLLKERQAERVVGGDFFLEQSISTVVGHLGVGY